MAIRRIKKHAEPHPLGRLKLYRDDLEAIAQVLAEFGELEITVNDELTGTEPEDFGKMRDELPKQSPERLERVRMGASRGETAVWVEIGSSAKAVLVEPDVHARGVLTNIKEICERRRMNAPLWAFLALAPMSVALPLYLFVVAIGGWSEELEFAVSVVLGLSLTVMVAVMAPQMVRSFFDFGGGASSKDIIINMPRAERLPFRERLFADSGVSAFWAVVGLLGGGMISYLVNQLPGL